MKTHLPEIERDIGPAEPRTRCGRRLADVALVSFDSVPTCKRCAARIFVQRRWNARALADMRNANAQLRRLKSRVS